MENTAKEKEGGGLAPREGRETAACERPSTEGTDFTQTKHTIVEALDKAIGLQAENEALRKQLEEERYARECAMRTLGEMQEKIDAWESDSFYKAVNINTILEYAQDPDYCDKNDVATIKLMLLALCSNKVPDEIIKKIKRLRCGGKFNIGSVGQINPAANVVHNHYHNE